MKKLIRNEFSDQFSKNKILAILWTKKTKTEKLKNDKKLFIDTSIRKGDLSESYDEPRHIFLRNRQKIVDFAHLASHDDILPFSGSFKVIHRSHRQEG